MSASPSVTVAVYGPNLRTTAEQIHVHRPGCADTGKALYRSAEPWTAEVPSVQGVVHAIYDPGDFCYDAEGEWERYLDDIKIFPCVTDLPYSSIQTSSTDPKESTMSNEQTTTTVAGVLAKDLVREATEAALARMPKGSKSRVKGDDLIVAAGEGEAVALAITEHMRAIVKENRSANMYREGKLRGVRAALVAAVPSAAAGAARPKAEKRASSTKAAERVADYQAAKEQAASDKKVAEARRTKVAPSAGNPPIPAKAS